MEELIIYSAEAIENTYKKMEGLITELEERISAFEKQAGSDAEAEIRTLYDACGAYKGLTVHMRQAAACYRACEQQTKEVCTL